MTSQGLQTFFNKDTKIPKGSREGNPIKNLAISKKLAIMRKVGEQRRYRFKQDAFIWIKLQWKKTTIQVLQGENK